MAKGHKSRAPGAWLQNSKGTDRAPPADPEGRDLSELGWQASRVTGARKRAEAVENADRVPTFEDFERAEDQKRE